jgi:hypothetical protein
MRAKKAASIKAKGPFAPASKNSLLTEEQAGKTRERVLAELALSPIVPNANTIRVFGKTAIGNLDLTEAAAVMREKTGAVQAGDLTGLEETLTAQAVTLDAIFNEMARRAALNMGQYLNAAESYLRLGLKAQAQCRATIQTLAEMKNPQPTTFVRQANVALGPQQVNNAGPTAGSSSRAGISANPSSELLELNHEQRLDTGTEGAASGAHSQLETVDALQRSED